MAQCTKCKKSVGCGCQLVNGVCDSCRKAEAEQKLKEKIKQQDNQPNLRQMSDNNKDYYHRNEEYSIGSDSYRQFPLTTIAGAISIIN